ncbi:MAG: CpaD family pilus assembly protein [Sphingomonadales bacterium]|nr:CpaD family pilus assembly protein [Sphingomonadales bacterium]MBK6720019.1 CpaD family pilus assembly protein [Sphingomonadales bacterium]MBK8861560.1 CpaD family pilus assembly protein [Sphingomonadales bacterium]
MRASHLATLIGMSAALAACGTQNRGVESVHQPVVSKSNYVLDVNSGYEGLAPGESSRVAGWFESLRLGYGDRVSVDAAGGSDAAVREAVADVASRYGLLIDPTAPVTSGEIAPGKVRVVVSRTTAKVPNCPDWSDKAGNDFNSNTMANYGCSINSNLAAMVANPEDLIYGQRATGANDASTASKAIKSYRDKAPTGAGPLKQEGSRSN